MIIKIKKSHLIQRVSKVINQNIVKRKTQMNKQQQKKQQKEKQKKQIEKADQKLINKNNLKGSKIDKKR